MSRAGDFGTVEYAREMVAKWAESVAFWRANLGGDRRRWEAALLLAETQLAWWEFALKARQGLVAGGWAVRVRPALVEVVEVPHGKGVDFLAAFREAKRLAGWRGEVECRG